jgi:hypothetical protein
MGYIAGVLFPTGVGNFLFSIAPRPILGPTQPPSQWILGIVSFRVKCQERQTDHSLPTASEVKKGRAVSPLSHMFSRGCA